MPRKYLEVSEQKPLYQFYKTSKLQFHRVELLWDGELPNSYTVGNFTEVILYLHNKKTGKYKGIFNFVIKDNNFV